MSRFRVADLVPPEIRSLHAYKAPEGEYAVRLDANESPFPLPPDLADEVREALARVAPNRYPDPASRGLRKAFALLAGVPVSRVMAGNGSDELITLLLSAFRAAPAGPAPRDGSGSQPAVLVPVPSFAMYFLSAQAAGFRVEGFPLSLVPPAGPSGDPGLVLDRDGFVRQVQRVRPNLVFLAQPNNPTGTLHPAATIEAVLEASPGLVVVDEAYGDFASEGSWIPRIAEFPNLAVLRTLSKVGGAALRCGFLAAREEVLHEVDKVRGPFNVGGFTQAAGEVLLSRPGWLAGQGKALAAAREELALGLRSLGLAVFPSQANFLLVKAGGREKEAFSRLAGAGIVVKSLARLPVVGDALRITVGSPQENRALLARLEGLFREEER